MSRLQKADKFHFENGLLKELRLKAAPVNSKVAKSARQEAKKASKTKAPKSVLSKLPKSVLRRLFPE